MEALFNALSEYIDFLVLGVVAFASFCAPFGLRPVTEGWRILGISLKGRGNGTFVQVGLISGALFALSYFSGYFLNAIGATFIYPAHVSIVDTVATRNQNYFTIMGLKPVFIARVVPILGPFVTPHGPELDNYWRDAKRQIFWQICDQKSADELLAGGTLKELRLLRGSIGLTQILLLLCLFAPWLDKSVERRRAWSLGMLVAAIYVVLVIPCYAYVEYDEHLTIWSVFPAGLDLPNETDKIDVDHMNNLLPCRKMQIIADQLKEESKVK
jgi:hypothetical protein